jgi:hypothetical protein
MSTVPAQQAIAQYHAEMQSLHGMDMHLFHANWHRRHPDPQPPDAPDRSWGKDLSFGEDFLQMHHEMVKATDDEPKRFMHHPSLASWYRDKGYGLPPEWDPMAPIPEALAFRPEPSRVRVAGEWIELGRVSEQPRFRLPAWFTRAGVPDDQPGEPLTGARKLADFVNANQLGCCIVYPHDEWHGRIGGAMSMFATAIADPIFYFGVHWQIDRVFDEYKLVLSARRLLSFDSTRVAEVLPPPALQPPAAFTMEQLRWIEQVRTVGRQLRRFPEQAPAATAARPRLVAPCRASYAALQLPSAVVVRALGVHQTPGHRVFFEEVSVDMFPPELALWHVQSAYAPELITPFTVEHTIWARQRVDSVTVHDAAGAHRVPVEPLRDAEVDH